MLANGRLERIRKPAGECAFRQIGLGQEFGEHAFLARQIDRRGVGGIAHALGNAGGRGPALRQVIPHTQHGQRVAHARKADPDAALGHGLIALLGQGPESDIQHVIERAHLQRHRLGERIKVKSSHTIEPERVPHKPREDDGPEVAATVRREWLFAARVGRSDVFAVMQVVVFVDAAQKKDARLGEVVGRLHDRVPQRAGLHRGVDPQAVCALACALRDHGRTGGGFMHQIPGFVVLHGLDEGVRHAHRHVEVVPPARCAFGGDELVHIGVVDAQYAHLRATA